VLYSLTAQESIYLHGDMLKEYPLPERDKLSNLGEFAACLPPAIKGSERDRTYFFNELC
jgi:hypothetical protein